MSARLTSLSVSNFRSIRGSVNLELDAPVILIHGANGSGKTSLLSALELGLTKSVASLNGSRTERAKNLIHFGSEEAIISVGCNHPDTSAKKSSCIVVRKSEINGKRILSSARSRFYSERCYLPQAKLVRLLEIYEENDARQGNSPLTRFVQELIGIDQIDNIVDGLHHLRDVRRLRKSVPEFAVAETKAKELSRLARNLKAKVENAQTARKTEEQLLHQALMNIGINTESELQEVVTSLRNSNDGIKEEEQLSVIKREVSAAKSLWNKMSGAFDVSSTSQAEADSRAAEAALKVWRERHESGVLAAIEAAGEILKALPNPRSVGFLAAHETAAKTISREFARLSARAEKDAEDKVLLAMTREALEKSHARAQRLSERMASLSKESGPLAVTLSKILPHIDGEMCPVCERDFSEVSKEPLKGHLAASISTLSRISNDLQEVAAEHLAVSHTISEEQKQVVELESLALDDNSRNRLATKISRLAEISQQLTSTKKGATEGEVLNDRSRSAAVALSEMRRNIEALDGLRVSTATFTKQLGIDSPTESESIPDILARCLLAIEEKQSIFAFQRQSRQSALKAALRLEQAIKVEESHKTDLRKTRVHQSQIELVLRNVDKTRTVGRQLSDKTIGVRTAIIRRVFNDSLNDVWKDLFIRLAPDEQFIPAFSVPESGTGPVVAKLATLYRGEAKAGNPRTMLSAGNLNTAALTLFLSLHLSVEPLLPWLVIDDPVQSMDEIHIAQFAALLRTLSRQRGRQIIVAVHEKPLFDYLALELSPAFEGDRLVTIELSRSRDQNTRCEYNMKVWKPEALLPRSIVG